MACHTPPLKKVKKQGEMTLPSIGTISSLKFNIFLKGWDWSWVMAFHLVSLFFAGWSMTGHP